MRSKLTLELCRYPVLTLVWICQEVNLTPSSIAASISSEAAGISARYGVDNSYPLLRQPSKLFGRHQLRHCRRRLLLLFLRHLPFHQGYTSEEIGSV